MGQWVNHISFIANPQRGVFFAQSATLFAN